MTYLLLALGKNRAYNTSRQSPPLQKHSSLQMPFWSPHLTWPAFWANSACAMQCTGYNDQRPLAAWRTGRRTRRIVHSPVRHTRFSSCNCRCDHCFPMLQQTETRAFGIQHSSTNDSRARRTDSEWRAARSHQNCWNGLIYSLFLPPSFLIITSYLQLQKGVSSARSDDTKGLKGAILDWIVPHGHSVHPPIARNVKIDRGFNHERTGALLCPADMDWSDPE